MEYILKRSSRKTISIRVKKDCSVVVGAPLLAPKSEIDAFVKKSEAWIFKNIELQKKYNEQMPEPSPQEWRELIERAKTVITPRAYAYAQKMGVTFQKISFGKAKGRFGSCSSKKELRFSGLLMRYPIEAVDYVIVHELAHLKEMNHQKRFYEIIGAVLPDYKERVKLLKKRYLI